jgi:hypothetical protein
MAIHCSHEVLEGKSGYCFHCRQAVIVAACTPGRTNQIGEVSIKQWLHWLFVRPWPIWSLLVVSIFIGYFGNWTLNSEGPGFNKICGASLQAAGALIVLFSLDGSLGLFRGRGILAAAMNWAYDFPKVPRRIVLEASGSCQSNSSVSAAASIRPLSIDGRVEELERVVIELRALISKRHNEVTESISAVRAEARESNRRTTDSVRELERKVIVAAVGGLKVQGFGVGLALLGSMLSVYS